METVKRKHRKRTTTMGTLRKYQMQIRAKKAFASEYLLAIKKRVHAKTKQMPKQWDGIEIRHLIAMIAAEGDILTRVDYGARRRECENEVLIRGL